MTRRYFIAFMGTVYNNGMESVQLGRLWLTDYEFDSFVGGLY